MFIKENRRDYGLGLCCRVFEISPSSYHQWLKRRTIRRATEDEKLLELIKYYYKLGRGNYGLPRITAAIRKTGIKVNKKRIYRLMNEGKIKAKTKRRFKRTTVQNKNAFFNENLLKQEFSSEKKNKVWTSDITYLWTKQGWLYLAVVMDIFSRKIIGWSTGKSLSSELVERALKTAITRREKTENIILHSDRGSQYTSSQLRKIIKNNSMIQSMSSTGSCYDNAVTESFFHTLKTELVYWNSYKTTEEAKLSIFEYIEIFYNRQRLHSSIGYLSPVEFEENNIDFFNKRVA